MPRIAVIDGDYEEMSFLMPALAHKFRGYQTFFYRSIGEFLEDFGLKKLEFSVLVLELVVPLFCMDNEHEEDNIPKRAKRLGEMFPWLGEDWDGVRGGEVLIRGLRSIQPNLSVVINTNFDLKDISDDVRKMDRLKICRKDVYVNKLVRAIQSFCTA